MKIGESVNESRTPVSVHVCPDCGARFTVCPPAGDDWGGCLADTCASYHISRDIDIFFEPMAEAGLIGGGAFVIDERCDGSGFDPSPSPGITTISIVVSDRMRAVVATALRDGAQCADGQDDRLWLTELADDIRSAVTDRVPTDAPAVVKGEPFQTVAHVGVNALLYKGWRLVPPGAPSAFDEGMKFGMGTDRD